MIKQGSMLLVVLLLSLPGCGGSKKVQGERGRKGRMVAKKADDFNTVNLALAEKEGLEVDETTKNFFNEMNEFVSFVESGDDFNLGEDIKKDEFAWKTAGAQPLDTVYFGFNKAKVDHKERKKVARNVDTAKKLLQEAGPDAQLVVEGHACASAGSDAYNLALSEKRAKEVSDQLVSAGVARDHVKTVGRGNEMLIVKEGGREEQAPNRRVEMHIVRS